MFYIFIHVCIDYIVICSIFPENARKISGYASLPSSPFAPGPQYRMVARADSNLLNVIEVTF